MLNYIFSCLRSKGDSFTERNTSKEVLLYEDVCVIISTNMTKEEV